MSTWSNQSDTNGAKETILLRKPAPKYNYQGRKLPKAEEQLLQSQMSSSTPIQNQQELPHSTQMNLDITTTPKLKPQQRPVAVVGASRQTNFSTPGALKSPEQPFSIPQLNQLPQNGFSKPSSAAEVDKSFQNKSYSTSTLTSETPRSLPHNTSTQSLNASSASSPNAALSHIVSVPDDVADTDLADGSSPPLAEQLQAVQAERDRLKKDLNAQIQVNTELKRLLVASVGDDLYQRVENLCRDRAQLELDIGGFSKKMDEDYENLDKISIQADMWRSKYLASRVMTEELSSARAYFSLQCHDSHNALQQLLNERHELRTNLVEGYKVLQQVKNAFDPLNTHRSSTLRSTNILDLSHTCQQLVDAIRYRLLPANVVINVSADVSDQAWQDSLTRAEIFAHEVLSRPIDANNTKPTVPEAGTIRTTPGHWTRYHPAVRTENLTMNCCVHCRGEIHVI